MKHRLVTLQLVKKAYDDTSKVDWKKYIDSANRELCHTLVSLKKFKAL